MNKISIIIPARYKSSRFPGKPLVSICGKEMIIHVVEKCQKVINKKNLFVATESKKIKEVVEKKNFNVIMTSSKCLTGTDRVAEASKKIKSNIFINVQGDEPLVSPKDIKKIIAAKKKYSDKVICGFSEINKNESPFNRNIPKVVLNKFNDLVYISRAAVPSTKKYNEKIKYLKQVCIYAFSKKELKKFYSLKKKGKIEDLEDIEILRFFDLGVKIKMIKLSKNTIAVDEKKDIYKVEKILKK